MKSGEWVQLFLGLCVLAGTVYGTLATRKSAKDNVGLQYLVQAATEQRTQLTEVRGDLTAVTTKLENVQGEVETMRDQIRDHRPWDTTIYNQAKQAGWDVQPPPPLS